MLTRWWQVASHTAMSFKTCCRESPFAIWSRSSANILPYTTLLQLLDTVEWVWSLSQCFFASPLIFSGFDWKNAYISFGQCFTFGTREYSKLDQLGAQAMKYYGGQRGKISLICLEGKPMTPCWANTILFCSSNNSLVLVSDPWRVFWADTAPFKGPQPRCVCCFGTT